MFRDTVENKFKVGDTVRIEMIYKGHDIVPYIVRITRFESDMLLGYYRIEDKKYNGDMTHIGGFPYKEMVTITKDIDIIKVYNPNTMQEVKLGQPSLPDSNDDSKYNGNKISDSAYVWITDKGELLAVEDMASAHILNAAKMIWNNKLPAAFRVGEYIRREEVEMWDNQYCKQAIEAFLNELNTRTDLDTEDRQVLDDLLSNGNFLSKLFELSKSVGFPFSVVK